jgi:hypothetical protein
MIGPRAASSVAVDLWSGAQRAGSFDPRPERVARLLNECGWSGRLAVLTHCAFRVTGAEMLNPTDAFVAGATAGRTGAARFERVAIDVGDGDAAIFAVDIVRELTAVSSQTAVAYRGGYRWVRTAQPVSVAAPAAARVASPGHYVIVGGVSPFTVAIADHLVRHGADRITIVETGDVSDAAPEPLASQLRAIGATAGVEVDVVRTIPTGRIRRIFWNIVDSPLAGANFAECVADFASRYAALDSPPAAGLVCGTRQSVERLRDVVAAVAASARWTVVSADAWSADGTVDAAGTAAFDVVAAVLSTTYLPDLHIGSTLTEPCTDDACDSAKTDGTAWSTTERTIARAWQGAIGSAQIGLDDDFFAIGGDSLVATQTAARLSRALRVTLSPDVFYDYPTVRALASFVDGAGTAVTDRELIGL